jgi:hypothetical protein
MTRSRPSVPALVLRGPAGRGPAQAPVDAQAISSPLRSTARKSRRRSTSPFTPHRTRARPDRTLGLRPRPRSSTPTSCERVPAVPRAARPGRREVREEGPPRRLVHRVQVRAVEEEARAPPDRRAPAHARVTRVALARARTSAVCARGAPGQEDAAKRDDTASRGAGGPGASPPKPLSRPHTPTGAALWPASVGKQRPPTPVRSHSGGAPTGGSAPRRCRAAARERQRSACTRTSSRRRERRTRAGASSRSACTASSWTCRSCRWSPARRSMRAPADTAVTPAHTRGRRAAACVRGQAAVSDARCAPLWRRADRRARARRRGLVRVHAASHRTRRARHNSAFRLGPRIGLPF